MNVVRRDMFFVKLEKWVTFIFSKITTCFVCIHLKKQSSKDLDLYEYLVLKSPSEFKLSKLVYCVLCYKSDQRYLASLNYIISIVLQDNLTSVMTL